MTTASNTPAPTTDALVAAFVASGKSITVVPPGNAVPPSPQSKPVATAKTAKRVKKAIAKSDAKSAAKTPRAKRTAAPKERVAVNPGKITLASIVNELGLNAKSARSILRRHLTKPADGWTFDAAAAKRVRALLSPKA